MTLKKMADLKKRLVVSSLALVVTAALITYSQNHIVSFILMLLVGILTAIGIWEYANLARAKGLNPAIKTMMAVAIAVVLAFYLGAQEITSRLLPLLVLGIGLVLFFIKRFKEIDKALGNIAVEFFGVCYLSVPLSMMLGILYPLPSYGTEQEGRFWLFYLIAVTKIADVAGYFIGRLFGKRPLAKELSPKKTIEGSIAGFFGSILMSIFLSYLGTHWFDGHFALSFPASISLGALIGIFSQLGDLAESLLKRDATVKDSNSLPGLGGILDTVDSILFTSPVLYFYLNMG